MFQDIVFIQNESELPENFFDMPAKEQFNFLLQWDYGDSPECDRNFVNNDIAGYFTETGEEINGKPSGNYYILVINSRMGYAGLTLHTKE